MTISSAQIFLYVDSRIDDGVAFYIGIGNEYRCRKIKRNKKHARISAKHGVCRNVVFKFDARDEACEYERMMIASLHTRDYDGGSNFTDGGDGAMGRRYTMSQETKDKLRVAHKEKKLSPETKLKVSMALTGEKNPNYGRQFSPEHCNKLSAANKGKRKSPEMKAILSAANKGKHSGPLSPEHRAHLSLAHHRRTIAADKVCHCKMCRGGL